MTYDEYYKKIYGQGTAQVKSAQDALDVQANANRDLINATADQNIADINTVYGTQIADAKEAAEIAHRKNEMQFSANERYLERKAAEMGLTDSGLNRTQMTANMLSHGNQGYEIDRQKQKTVDTLAAAMASKIAAENTTRNSSLAGIDSQLAIDKAKVESDWRDTAAAEATKLYEKDKENEAKYQYEYDEKGNIINVVDRAKVEDAYSKLFGMAVSGDYTEDAIKASIMGYAEKYGFASVSEAQRILNAAGITAFNVVEKDGALAFSDEVDDGETVGKSATSSNFKTYSGGNFTITVGDKEYAVENQGKVKNSKIKDKIAAAKAYGSVRYYDGKMYYEKDGEFYEIGPREGFLNIHYGGTRDFDRLKDALLYV
jgi:hypothetical protein